MPPVKQPKRPTIQKSTEERDVEKLAEVLWKHGDPTTEHCRREIVKAGIRMDEVTPTMLHKAEELNQERLREGFRTTNADSSHHVKVVVVGDGEFDPALNPKHPIRGAAKVKEETEKGRFAESASGSSLTKEEKEKAESLKAKKGPEEEKGKTEKQKEGPSTRGQRYELFGYPVTAVFRWMGKQGWSVDDAMKAAAYYNIACSPSTVKIQVKAGAKGERGEPAELSSNQVKELKKVTGKG